MNMIDAKPMPTRERSSGTGIQSGIIESRGSFHGRRSAECSGVDDGGGDHVKQWVDSQAPMCFGPLMRMKT